MENHLDFLNPNDREETKKTFEDLRNELTHPGNELKFTGCITLIEQNYWSFILFLQHKTGEILINNSYN